MYRYRKVKYTIYTYMERWYAHVLFATVLKRFSPGMPDQIPIQRFLPVQKVQRQNIRTIVKNHCFLRGLSVINNWNSSYFYNYAL